jgi:hypothetical protein
MSSLLGYSQSAGLAAPTPIDLPEGGVELLECFALLEGEIRVAVDSPGH